MLWYCSLRGTVWSVLNSFFCPSYSHFAPLLGKQGLLKTLKEKYAKKQNEWVKVSGLLFLPNDYKTPCTERHPDATQWQYWKASCRNVTQRCVPHHSLEFYANNRRLLSITAHIILSFFKSWSFPVTS